MLLSILLTYITPELLNICLQTTFDEKKSCKHIEDWIKEVDTARIYNE